MKFLKEIYDIYDQEDFDNAPSDEKEFRLVDGGDPTKSWIKLRTWYNWDNPYDEVLYFFERNSDKEYLMAVSFGTTADGEYLIKIKEFKYGYNDDYITFQDSYDDDPWEIYKKDIEPSDEDSLIDVLKHVCEDKLIIDKDAFSSLR